MRDLLSPCQYTDSGYRLYAEMVPQCLRLIGVCREAGLSLGKLERLCKAMGDSDTERFQRSVVQIRGRLAQKIGLKRKVGRQLSTLLP